MEGGASRVGISLETLARVISSGFSDPLRQTISGSIMELVWTSPSGPFHSYFESRGYAFAASFLLVLGWFLSLHVLGSIPSFATQIWM